MFDFPTKMVQLIPPLPESEISALFVSDLVGNSQNRFSHNVAQLTWLYHGAMPQKHAEGTANSADLKGVRNPDDKNV